MASRQVSVALRLWLLRDQVVTALVNTNYPSKASLISWEESSVQEKDARDALALRRPHNDPHAFD